MGIRKELQKRFDYEIVDEFLEIMRKQEGPASERAEDWLIACDEPLKEIPDILKKLPKEQIYE